MASMGTKKKKITAPNLTGNQHLEQSPVNLLSLREHGRNEISNILSRVEGKTKHLIWDSNLIGPLNYIIQLKMLNNLGIQVRTTLNLKSDRINSDCDSIIYLSRPTIPAMKAISNQIVTHSKGRKKNFYLLLMPRRTFLCMRALKMYGALGSLNPIISSSQSHILDLNIEWYPIDADVISLQYNECLSELLSGNISSLMYISQALCRLQQVFGRFPIIRSKGDFSCSIVDIMRRLITEDNDLFDDDGFNNVGNNNISQCIIIDRTIDMITPCLTPKTYEGLLDEIFGIENSIIKVNKNLLGKSAQKTKTRGGGELNIVLNSSDSIFAQIRDTSFRYLGKLLSTMAEHIRLGYEARHEAKTSKELNAYIKRFKNLHADHSLVEQHVHLADFISSQTNKKMKWKRKMEHEFALLMNELVPNGTTSEDYLEELIGRGESIYNVLKFMILISLCNGGIISKKYDIIKKNIIQTYGFKYLLTLNLFEKYLLISYSSTLKRLYSASSNEYFNWNNVKNKFNLIKTKQEINYILKSSNNSIPEMVSNPSILGQYDLNLIGSYTNGGYAPLSARLVEAATKANGWKSIYNELKELKGKCYINQNINIPIEKNKNNNENSGNNKWMENINKNEKKEQQKKEIKEEKRKQKAQQKSDAMSTHKTVLVFFVGGVTYAEISAIRMLEQRPNTPWKFIIGSTNIANGNDIIKAFIDKEL